MAATLPASFGKPKVDDPADIGSDQDAEGDDDIELYPPVEPNGMEVDNGGVGEGAGENVSDEPLDESARQLKNDEEYRELQGTENGGEEGEEDNDAYGEEDVDYAIPSMKKPSNKKKGDNIADDSDVAYENQSRASDEEVASNQTSDDDSEVDEEWDAESNDKDDADGEELVHNVCM